MKTEIQNPYPDNNCFFCGSENPIGLKLKFYWDEEKKEAYAKYLPDKHFVGQGDILHGAIQMGLLDEIMGWTSYVVSRQMAVTSEISIQFLHPLYVSDGIITVRCRATSQQGPKINMQGELLADKGICTTATGNFHIVSSDKYKKRICGK